ncbi:putative bifunctional diguanylate cyclase/phosphodiesterase [Frateuria sp. YIM B11624]|uniref:putative bifunctional diguanylate cyclase/phosphodiesterase n=1 Tax=Frateuria sp. YIM B11624 TaxID=3143185 RepID=UPI003C76E5D5
MPLLRRLLPLGYALAGIIALILALTWGALQVQVTLAGFLNGESLWSKAQKQAVIDLDAYAASGNPADLAGFRRNHALVASDRWARDAIASDHFDRDAVARAFARGEVIPSAIPGMIFIFDHFSGAPYIRQAVAAWRSTDESVGELSQIADRLESAYVSGGPSAALVASERARVAALNAFIEPQTKLFSLEIARGAAWLGHMLFAAVLAAACIALLLWLRMARRILADIRGTEERYRLLFDRAADAILMVDEERGHILDANQKAVEWTGQGTQELIGTSFAALFERRQPRGEGITQGTLRDRAGHERPVETQSSLVRWGDRSVRQAIVRDISERLSLEQERRIAAEALASIAEGVIIADADRRVVSVNAAHAAITGLTLQDVQGHRFDETRRLADDTPLPASVWDTLDAGGNWLGEVHSQRADGSVYPELLSISVIRDAEERVQHYVAVFTNISTTKANQRRLEHLATHDPLTGLANRAEFERQCAQAIAAADRGHGAVAVLFIDLDAFKVVNDSYSHAIGDRLLVHVAERITRDLGEHDVAGRIGGDEFTVLIGRLVSREQASALAQRLLSVLGEPMKVGDYEVALSASIGIAGYPLDGSDPVTLIANADAAMYAAKTQERNTFRLYSPMMQADARKRLALAAELRQALTRGEFRLVFQPSVDMRSGKVVAVEALLRWRHPARGEISPGEFIPMAEKLGLIRHVDDWVLQAVARQMRRWDEEGMPPIRVAVNISAGTYGAPQFVEDVRRFLVAERVAPQRLLLEITEGAILRLGDEMERTMNALHSLGVGVAIDDFGTGYSSMAYLKLPAIAFLKIDKSFVDGLPGNTHDAAIVEAMLALSKRLGLCAIAEGIETEAQHEFLLRAGCTEGQGYLYARALEVPEIERMLRPGQRPGSARLRLVPPAN